MIVVFFNAQIIKDLLLRIAASPFGLADALFILLGRSSKDRLNGRVVSCRLGRSGKQVLIWRRVCGFSRL